MEVQESMNQKISIKDVAKKAGVCISTVSIALNKSTNKGLISQVTIERIRDIAKRLNYQPNSFAKSLRTGRSGLIGFLVEDISNPFYAKLASALENQADQLGYTLVITNLGKERKNFQRKMKAFNGHLFDAFIIAPIHGIYPQLQALLTTKRPVVFFDQFVPGLNSDFVLTDHFHALKLGTMHLIKKGYSNIALIKIESNNQQFINDYTRYMRVMKSRDKKISVLDIPKHFANDTQKRIIHFFDKHHEIDALIFAPGAFAKTMLSLGRGTTSSFIQNMKIVAYDNFDLLKHLMPTITFISTPIEEICLSIMEKLNAKISANHEVLPNVGTIKVKPLIIEAVNYITLKE